MALRNPLPAQTIYPSIAGATTIIESRPLYVGTERVSVSVGKNGEAVLFFGTRLVETWAHDDMEVAELIRWAQERAAEETRKTIAGEQWDVMEGLEGVQTYTLISDYFVRVWFDHNNLNYGWTVSSHVDKPQDVVESFVWMNGDSISYVASPTLERACEDALEALTEYQEGEEYAGQGYDDYPSDDYGDDYYEGPDSDLWNEY